MGSSHVEDVWLGDIAGDEIIDDADQAWRHGAEDFTGDDADHEWFHAAVELAVAVFEDDQFDDPAKDEREAEQGDMRLCPHHKQKRVKWPVRETHSAQGGNADEKRPRGESPQAGPNGAYRREASPT